MNECQIADVFQDDLLQAGWTRETFQFCVTRLEDLDDFLTETFAEPIAGLPLARFRLLWNKCQQVPTAPAPSEEQDTPVAAEGSQGWSETFAPRMATSKIRELKQAFEKAYPSELLTADNCPSTRLLSLVFKQVSAKEWRWIPWKWRLSITKHDEVVHSRTPKLAKVEHLQLHDLMCDEPPALDIANMGMHAVNTSMHVHNLAIAICRGAHLATLNTYKNRFMQLLSARFEQSSGLRAPSLQEAQQADQRLWQQVGELVTGKGWKLDDAIYEFAVLRPDMQALLQPRCKPVILAHPGNSFATSSSRKGGKAQGKGKKSAKGPAGPKRPGLNSQQWIAEVVKDGRRHTLCMQWNAGRCSMAQCNFLHACAYPKADGVACAGSHAARDHASASH
ncbi:unnamed protein product [Effrenium voratum]|nr:unnamed protein product [Effrenium voratum]